MQRKYLKINNIPAVIYGEKSDNAYLFVHGKCGWKEEAERFAEIANGYQVVGIDLPGHGERKTEIDRFNPWDVKNELSGIADYMLSNWKSVSLRANSIGALFCMMSLNGKSFRKCLFVSPLVDMERLICDMMTWANVSEDELMKKGEISTDFGETLSWKYLEYVRKNPVAKWDSPTAVLYADKDNLTSIETISDFTNKFSCSLKIMKDGEHWFHTPEQLAVLGKWERENI